MRAMFSLQVIGSKLAAGFIVEDTSLGECNL